MRKLLFYTLILFIALSATAFAQEGLDDVGDPRPWGFKWDTIQKYIWYGEFSFYNKTFADTTTFNGMMILENDEYFENASDGVVRYFYNDDGTLLGTFTIASSLDSSLIEDDNRMEYHFQWKNSENQSTSYGKIICKSTDVTDGTEDSEIYFQTYLAGVLTTGITITGDDVMVTDDLTVGDDLTVINDTKLGSSVMDSLGRVLVMVQNKSGGALAAGDVVVWDATDIQVVADVAISDDHTIANDLSGEGGYLKLRAVCTGTPDAGDSVWVAGNRYGVGADTTSFLLPATLNPIVMFPGYWSSIDSVAGNADAVADGATAMNVQAVPVAGVVACDGANTDIAGVAVGAIADNAFGYICVWGVTNAIVDCASTPATPGALIEGAANGDGVIDAAATTGKNFARALEYCNTDNTSIKVFVDSF